LLNENKKSTLKNVDFLAFLTVHVNLF